jgi:subtilisin family serine protease
MKLKQFLSAVFLTVLTFSSVAQPIPGTLNWYNGTGTGMSTELAYKKILKKRKATPVIVAVIDSGVDLEHEDLKGKIWVNTKEIPNNKKDDDGNGYVDDVYGWNFLGNAKGENQDKARLEKARIVKKYGDKFDGIDPGSMAYDPIHDMFVNAENSLKDDIAQYEEYREMIGTGMFDKETEEYLKDQLFYNLNIDYDDRSLIGDNPDDFSDNYYGNGNAEGPDALHGTHVAGIVGALRGNGKGGDGVADAAVIMSVRAVPNGDEHDKDVALAIRYAVDNGAKVINMSFGKGFSPYHDQVQEAIAYAASKDVLMIHAAGNDAADIDYTDNFPKKPYFNYEDSLNRKMFLNIGANTRNTGEQLVASFSNYGALEVDVFAPGFEIYNSVPQSEYQNLQGTSMAAPMVAGVAALLKSRYPQATMLQISEAITRTVQKYDELADKCITGGVVNVYNAAVYLQNLYK